LPVKNSGKKGGKRAVIFPLACAAEEISGRRQEKGKKKKKISPNLLIQKETINRQCCKQEALNMESLSSKGEIAPAKRK